MMKLMPKFLAAILGTLLLSLAFVVLPFSVRAQENPLGSAFCEATDKYSDVMSKEACLLIAGLFDDETEGPWYSQNSTQFAKKVLDTTNPTEIFGERYTYAQINWIINSIATMANPAADIDSPEKIINLVNGVRELLSKTQNGELPSFNDYAQLGPAGLFASGLSTLYSNPPASAVEETKQLAERIFDTGTGAQPAYAQGFGFRGLNTQGAVRSLWTASRNMSYFVVVILLIASGFLIMFRIKINPQTVVSLQVMIPKLIITLILITFSFAIAGFVIDLIYVFILAILGFLNFSGVVRNFAPALDGLTNNGFGVYFAIQTIPTFLFSLIVLSILGIVVGYFTVGAGFIISTILAIIVFVFFLITCAKIFWMMLKAYVMLILQVCVGPLQIMLDLVPGQQGFGPWLRGLISNASVFVVVPVMLLIQNILATNFFTAQSWGITDFGSSGGTGLQLPYVGWEGNLLLSWGIGFVIFTITPKVADMIRDALKVPAFKYESAIGEAFMEPKKWYDQFVGMQKARDEEALRRLKIQTETKADRSFGSAGLGGIWDDAQAVRQASSPKAPTAQAGNMPGTDTIMDYFKK